MLIATVSLENRHFTHVFLQSIYRTKQQQIADTLVIDNGSLKDDILSLKTEFPKTQFVRFEQHLGVAPAWNFALKYGQYDYCAIMNNDMIVGSNFVILMKEFMDQYPKVGISSGFVNDCRFFEATEINDRYWQIRGLYINEQQILQALEYTYMNYAEGPGTWNGFDEFCKMCEEKYVGHEGLPQFLGSGFIMRKTMVEEIGYFNEFGTDGDNKIGLSEDFDMHERINKCLNSESQPKWLERLNLRASCLHLSMMTRSNPKIVNDYHHTTPDEWESRRHQLTKQAWRGKDLKPT